VRLRLLFAVWLVFASFAAAQDAPKVHLRFFNDSAKAVNFYVDGQFSCYARANPEGNEEYCDTFEARVGNRTISIKGARLPHLSCDVYVSTDGAYVNLSKGESLHCLSHAGVQ
jgi:hypothetical protein